MVKAELGTKRTCPACATRFYDLLKNPILCPKCGVSFIAATILPSKGDMPAQAPVPKPRVVADDDADPNADIELVSLEDAEEKDTDDETAGIEDVDLGDEAESTAGEEDLLVEEEEGADGMGNLIEGGPAGKEDEEEA